MKCEIFNYFKLVHPRFNNYSKLSQEKIVDEVFKRSQKLNVDQRHSLIKKVILSEPGKCVVPPIDHPIGDMFNSLLLAESNWRKKIPSNKEIFSFLPSLLWQMDPVLFKAARQWLQSKITFAAQEVPSEKIRAIYLRNLLSYYPFFSPEKGDEIQLPFGPLGSTLTYQVDPIELTNPSLGSPLMAYGLVPKINRAPPILLFKGTTYPADKGFYLSLLTDINPYGAVGSFAFQFFAKEKIKEWLVKHSKKDFKVEVMGASLGGCLSLQTASAYPEYIKAVHAFNSPGVTFNEIASWKKAQEKPQVHVYLQEGDFISSFVGRCFAPDWHVYRVFAQGVSASQVHSAAYTAHPEAFVIPEKTRLVNEDVRRRVWPFIQNTLLFPVFLLGSGFLILKVLSNKSINSTSK